MTTPLIAQIEQQLTQLSPAQQSAVLDFIRLLQHQTLPSPPPLDETQSQRIRAAFQKLAEMQTFVEIADPVAWQREQRRDRPLL